MVTPETLTDEMVQQLQRMLDKQSDNDASLYLDTCWHFASHIPRENKREARQRICDAINARQPDRQCHHQDCGNHYAPGPCLDRSRP